MLVCDKEISYMGKNSGNHGLQETDFLMPKGIYFMSLNLTLENHCTRTVQSSLVASSQKGHKIYYFGLL